MTKMKTVYLGGLRTEAEHLQSGNKLITDAPLDNNGKGEFFSPTDLLATSLGSCMLTIMAFQLLHTDTTLRVPLLNQRKSWVQTQEEL